MSSIGHNRVLPVLGAVLCLVAAFIATFALRGTPLKDFLPLMYLGVVILVALRCGSSAGIIGTLVAALTFAEFLFDPLLSIRVSDLGQRNHLIWMVIIGIAASELLGREPKIASRVGSTQAESSSAQNHKAKS